MVYTDQAIYFNGECFKWENTDSRVEIIESDFNFSEVELCETETDWIYQTRLWRRKKSWNIEIFPKILLLSIASLSLVIVVYF